MPPPSANGNSGNPFRGGAGRPPVNKFERTGPPMGMPLSLRASQYPVQQYASGPASPGSMVGGQGRQGPPQFSPMQKEFGGMGRGGYQPQDMPPPESPVGYFPPPMQGMPGQGQGRDPRLNGPQFSPYDSPPSPGPGSRPKQFQQPPGPMYAPPPSPGP
ncbi:hypothetical protein HK104_007100, partial [Borealophlyctis nickersoniae]